MTFLKKDKVNTFFEKNFSFEKGIDLSDNVEVLFRRNIVIKNIILVSNLLYSFILFIISYGSTEPGSWLYTVIPLPLTYLVNKTIKGLIYTDKKELIRQQIAMYMSAFYMFLSAILLYFKLKTGADSYLSEAGYMLLYYSLIVVSLYQDRTMLKTVFGWMIAIITILHITLTYDIYNADYAQSFFSFIGNFYKTDEFKDIFLRTVILLCFMLVVYSICVIGEILTQARNQELSKRKDIQEDFTGIVSDLFQVLIKSRFTFDDDNEYGLILSKMSFKLASLYGFSPKKCEEIAAYALFLETHENSFEINTTSTDSDEIYEKLHEQTTLGSQLVKRIELSNKAQNIVRAHIEGFNTEEFTTSMIAIQDNIESQIILLADIYISLRSVKSFKRPYPHRIAMESLEERFNIYFDRVLFERFIKFASDFEAIYNE